MIKFDIFRKNCIITHFFTHYTDFMQRIFMKIDEICIEIKNAMLTLYETFFSLTISQE